MAPKEAPKEYLVKGSVKTRAQNALLHMLIQTKGGEFGIDSRSFRYKLFGLVPTSLSYRFVVTDHELYSRKEIELFEMLKKPYLGYIMNTPFFSN